MFDDPKRQEYVRTTKKRERRRDAARDAEWRRKKAAFEREHREVILTPEERLRQWLHGRRVPLD